MLDRGYVLSLPERSLRSLVALAGGLVRELAGVALPAGLRRTRLYHTLVDTTLRFLVERVGGVEGEWATEQSLAEDFLMRRAAGNGLELIGILTFRASPVWVLAALADLSGAGRQLINEISRSLQEAGLLPAETKFETMDQLLDGLEASSGRLAEAINTPPLDVASLRAEWAAIRKAAAKIPTPDLPRVEALSEGWRALQSEAAAQGRSVFELSSLLALSAIRNLPERLSWLTRAGGRAARAAGMLYSRALLDHYAATLAGIREQGFAAYWRQEFRPYLKAAAQQFSPRRLSLTQRWLDRRGAR